MRISGGSAKGRRVGVRRAFAARGEGDELRPTSSKVRQAIFDILAERIEDAEFLDLYAGTGAVGLEALSRGARKAVFVERNSKRAEMIKKYADEFGFSDRTAVVKDGAESFLRKTARRFDVAFVDPPYGSDEVGTVLALMDDRNVMNEDGTVILEHSSKSRAMNDFRNLILLKSYRYGDSSLTVYRRESI